MGSSRWDPSAWSTHSKSVASTPMSAIFTTSSSTAGHVVKDYLPTNFKFRESCDSTPNPESTPIIVGVDVTGSMGKLADIIVKEGLGTLIEEVYNRKPVHDPHVLLMCIGDVECDGWPIQATQFEADMRLVEQLTKLYVEGGGGGNGGESYNAAWYFAANHTKTDSFLKRKKKGYLFTVGDEAPLYSLSKDAIKEFFGDDVQHDLNNRELLTLASESWEIFHLMVDEPSHRFAHGDSGKADWKDLLGERAMILSDHTKLAEVIVSTMQVIEGADAKTVSGSWNGNTGLVVSQAINGLATVASSGSGVKRI